MDDYQSFTLVDDIEILSTNTNFDPICIYLLPGENFMEFNSLNYGCRLGLTNYRIIIIYDIIKDKKSTSDIISIPLGLIYHLEQVGFVCLNIVTKIGRKFSVTFPNIELCEEIIKIIKKERSKKPFAIDYYGALKSDIPSHFLLNNNSNFPKLEKEILESEFIRMKFKEKFWRISEVNNNLKICSTYPQYHIVPKCFPDDKIKEMAKFRSRGRFISVSYRSVDTGTVMLRSGQPLTGVSCWRNNADENYFSVINEIQNQELNLTDDNKLKIFDARSYTSAQLNRVKGGGIEYDAYYPISNLEYLNIPNMHSVRSSFDSLAKALLDNDSDSFYDLIDRSLWLQLIRQLLKSASVIADTMCVKKKSVLIHCSDGWDRTPQLVALVQLLMDPYYRTTEGFRILIYREWILFGHKFNERCALWPVDFSKEYSPIFLQWLDCVYQLLHQYPDHFHFNETFLIKLAIHVYSGLFGTFNIDISESNVCCSIWNYLCEKEMHNFVNPLYSPHTTFRLIKPKLLMSDIKLWKNLYFGGLNPNFHDIYHPKKLKSEIPDEISKIAMQNSFINGQEDLDDYEGEDVISKPPLLTEISDEISNKYSPLKFDSNVFNYFNAIVAKNSIKTIEKDLSDNPNIHLELDLDGLYKQNDLICRFYESNRHNRHLFKKRIQILMEEIEFLKRKFNEKSIENEIEIVGSLTDDIHSFDSQFDPIEELVRWIPDHAVTHCTNCKHLFTIALRKHHCRSCGNIFCHQCSKNKTPVPKQKLDYSVRVCESCFQELSTMKPNDTSSHSSYFFTNFPNFWQ